MGDSRVSHGLSYSLFKVQILKRLWNLTIAFFIYGSSINLSVVHLEEPRNDEE
jgi:hypothetical protein